MKQEMLEALKEVQNVCKEAKCCGKCPFFIKNGPDDDGYYDTLCMFDLAPVNWDLELVNKVAEAYSMTDREKAIVMAYTGVCMLTGDKFSIFHKYIEELLGRPVFAHELGDKEIANLIREKAKDDFIGLWKEEKEDQNETTVSL